jgi:hypothetical protein
MDVADRLACLRTIAAEAREMAERAASTEAFSRVESLRFLARHYDELAAQVASQQGEAGHRSR